MRLCQLKPWLPSREKRSKTQTRHGRLGGCWKRSRWDYTLEHPRFADVSREYRWPFPSIWMKNERDIAAQNIPHTTIAHCQDKNSPSTYPEEVFDDVRILTHGVLRTQYGKRGRAHGLERSKQTYSSSQTCNTFLPIHKIIPILLIRNR